MSGGAPGGSIAIQEFPQKRRLVEQDKNVRNVLVIRSGIVKCFITEENGKEYILEFLGEGEILGEIEAIRRTPGMATVETLTPVSAFTIEKTFFLQLLKADAAFNQAVLELMAGRLVNTAMRASRQQLYTLSHNLSRLLKILQQGQIAFTKQDLSDYLGISKRSLNRLLKEN
jgi:CRP-like cAMP-binding protein